MTGTIKTVNRDRGFGFILAEGRRVVGMLRFLLRVARYE
jgi:'Cold-shock' DNA-binding domain